MSALEGFSRPRPDDVLERLGREKEAEVVTGVFTIPLARMGPLCRSIDLDPAMLVQALRSRMARCGSRRRFNASSEKAPNDGIYQLRMR